MNSDRSVGCVAVLVGLIVVAGVLPAAVAATPVAQLNTTNTSISETTDSVATSQTTTDRYLDTTDHRPRNGSNVTVPLNSTVLPETCSVSVAARGNVTIPIAKSGNETIETANVSAAWLAYTDQVDRVADRVTDRLPDWVSNTSAIRSTSVGRSNNTTVGGETGFVVVVGVAPSSVEAVRNEVPHHLDCVEIVVRPEGPSVATGGSAVGRSETTDHAPTTNVRTTTGEMATAIDAGTAETTASSTTTANGSGFGFGAVTVAVCAVAFVRWRRQ